VADAGLCIKELAGGPFLGVGQARIQDMLVHGWLPSRIFKDVGRQLDNVEGATGAGEMLKTVVAQEGVQCMAKLVE
jgi:hypothetical protein